MPYSEHPSTGSLSVPLMKGSVGLTVLRRIAFAATGLGTTNDAPELGWLHIRDPR
jgi:hypothetical protein